MSKILITALGSGTYNKEKNEKEYKLATYYLEEGHPLEKTELIASAIDEQWKMDKIIFIGTTGSMWSNVYKFYCKNKRITMNDEYYNKLKNTELSANKDTLIENLEIEKFNATFDKKIKGIVIKYGVDNKENLENFHSIIEIEKEIEDGDEIFIDITHSFRSMSFWLFLIMTYLKDVSNKNIDIKNITYGMFEAPNEKKETPIVSLNLFIDILKWFKGASELKNYGNSYSILEELEKNLEDKDIKNELKNFSNTMNINYIDSLKESLKNFDTIKNKLDNLEGPGKYIVPQIFENFINEFKFQNDENLSNEEKKYLLRAKLAKWHCEQKRYAMAAININEAIVDFIMEVLNFPIKDTKAKTSETDLAKIWLEKIEKVEDEEIKKYGTMYVETRSIRNKSAHSLERETDLKDDIKNLEIYSSTIFNSLLSKDLVKEKDSKLGLSEKLKREYEEEEKKKKNEKKGDFNLFVISDKGLDSEEIITIKNKFKIAEQPIYLSKKEKEKWKSACEKNDKESLEEFKKIINNKTKEGDYILIIGDFEYKKELEEYSSSKNLKVMKIVFKKSFKLL
ncbi:TIGR02221 family CRISPR-associated protein [Fusobacterium polymorphum]|jgi:CRISPR-associated protein, TM1812 family|uniref:CRISPR-associated protein n=2 Tax=Fusobacterium TaxID=848 RepID=A0A241Q133_FUSNP|nr:MULTISPECIES: TIGR02221 family CRISPR-associated protein [Fusobacterium]ASG28456.1 CRISPR-associated protein [Fusobacterium polymorphum]ETZ29904.1 tm1812 family CRISPR-associated protein [Fusobacterium nucleatum 13_3C]